MSREETTILVLALAGLCALLLWRYRVPAEVEEAVSSNPRYVTNLTYNQPFMFSPPVASVLPNMAASQLGEEIDGYTYYNPSSCGC